MDDDLSPRKNQTTAEIFDECCPFYISIGMTATEYWDGDASLPRYYRKAYKMKQQHENEQAWLHGLYVYDATISALTHLSPNKNNHKNYTAKPYSFNGDDADNEHEDNVIEAQAQAEVWMKSWAAATQKHFDKK